MHNDKLFTDEEIPVSDLGEKIIAFMLDNDNSFECPDKKEGVCYCRDTIEILHKKFLAEAMVACSLSTFAWYLPKNVVNPKPEDWGTSLCKTCLNPELKIEALRDPEVKLETLLSLDDAQLKNGVKNSMTIITS